MLAIDTELRAAAMNAMRTTILDVLAIDMFTYVLFVYVYGKRLVGNV
jgi:hypothetical protein